MDAVQEIKNRLSMYDLVSSYVPLKKAGRNYRGLCPFHQEKTPSFMVSPDKEICYCFGCKQGGDIFEFMRLVERVDFKEALELLADRAGVTLPSAPAMARSQAANEAAKNIYRTANRLYQEDLQKNLAAKEYLHQKRGLTPETISFFELGYTPDVFENITLKLLQEGFSHKDILDSGLALQKDITSPNIYDRFRGRIMIPFFNVQGNIVGYTGRIIGADDPKYLNSPETALFKKGKFLYGLFHAKEAIREHDQVLIVEGNLDVIRSYQAGVKQVVASSGTALTSDQVRMLKRYTNNFILCFDADKAGFEALKRAVEILITEEVNIFVLPLPAEIKDPDQFIEIHGTAAWQSYIHQKVYILDFLLDRAFQSFPADSREGKQSILALLFPFLSVWPSAVERDHYLTLLSEKIGTSVRSLMEDMKRSSPEKKHTSRRSSVSNQPVPAANNFSLEERLLGLILSYPSCLSALQYVEDRFYQDPKTEKFYKYLKSLYNQQGNFDLAQVKGYFEPKDHDYISILSLCMEEMYQDMSQQIIADEGEKIARRIQLENLKRFLKTHKGSQEIAEIQKVIMQLK